MTSDVIIHFMKNLCLQNDSLLEFFFIKIRDIARNKLELKSRIPVFFCEIKKIMILHIKYECQNISIIYFLNCTKKMELFSVNISSQKF